MTRQLELANPRRALTIAIAVLVWTSPAVAQDPASSGFPEVETVGTGERRVAPDRASVHLQIQAKAKSASLAAAANGRILQRVRDTLKTMGLEAATTTASYSVGPNYERQERGEPVRDGYVAHTILRVQLAKLNDVGQVIDAGLATGATGVEGVMFESSVVLEARRGALADAAAAARADAEVLAKAMGGTLGPLISTATAGGYDARRANVMMRSGNFGGGVGGSGGGLTQITPNEIVVTAGVVARWRFIASR